MQDKNYEELLAVIGAGSSSAAPANNAFSPARTPMPIPTAGVPKVTPPAANRPRPTNPNLSESVNKNLTSLYDLLGSNQGGSAPTAGASALPPNDMPGYRNHAIMTPVQQSLPQQNISAAHVAGMGQAAVTASQFRRKQAVGVKQAAIKRESVQSSSGGARVAAPAVPANRQAPNRGGVHDIAAEINALQRNSNTTDRAPAQSARSASSASVRHRAATSAVTTAGGRHLPNGTQAMPQTNNMAATGSQTGHISSGAHPPGGNAPAPNPQQQQRPKITQEQIIVGHFCRHAIKTLTLVMENKPLQKETEIRLKEHIKSVWASWVKGLISRQKLLESVAGFVRGSCPEAINIDVIKEFKVWYEREFELQKRRTAEQERLRQQQQHRQLQQRQQQQLQQRQQQQLQQRQLQHRQMQQQARPAPDARLPASGNVPTAAQPSVARAQTQVAAGRSRTTPGNRGNAATKAKDAQIGAAGASPQAAATFPGDPRFPQGSRTGGKSISNKTVASRKAPATKGARGTGVKGAANKSVANKSVGSKSIARTPVGANAGQIGIKGPAVPPAGKPAAHGSKSLVGNKGPAASKVKGIRKPTGKTATKTQPKAPPKGTSKTTANGPSKVSPKSAAKQKTGLPVSTVGAAHASVGGVGVNGKRPLDMSAGSPSGSVAKKSKTAPKGPKGNVGRKKNAPAVQGALGVGKAGKPPPARPDMLKGRPPSGPNTVGGSGTGEAAGMKPGGPMTNAPPVKRVRGVDDELNVYHNVVDLENEEDMLGRDAGGGTTEVIEVMDYDSDMLLAGPRLRSKMHGICKRHGLNEGISKDVLEMMSLAARERLSSIFEGLKSIAAVRTEANKSGWKTETIGPSIYDKLERMREDEERSLTVAAEMRIKRKKEQQEREAKKLAGEAAQEEKAKDSSATAEAERKEKLALEKKRKENSSQRDALSGLLASFERRKKPNASKGLAPLGELAPIGPLKGLPPIMRRPNTDSGGGKKLTTAQQLEKLGPLTKLGGTRISSMPGKNVGGNKIVAKAPLSLRDCIFLAESEAKMRKSSLLYKWYARLDAGGVTK